MPVLATVAFSVPNFVFHERFCFAVEDENSDSELVACLATAAKVVLPDFELVPESKELLASGANSYCLDSGVVGILDCMVHGSTLEAIT